MSSGQTGDASSRVGGDGQPSLGEAARHMAHQATQDVTSRIAQPLAEEVRRAAERHKQHGADQLSGVAEAIRRAARELEPDLPQTAACIGDAAGGLERLSASLRRHSVGDLAGRFNLAARERPVAVLASAMLLGFVLTRVLRDADPGVPR